MTTFALTWLPDVLESAGLKVAEVPGWRTRGRADMGKVRGVILHHTANPHPGNMPTLRMLIDGRPDLGGPLCQLGLGRDGTFYVVAAGKANHAGAGAWESVTTGNSNLIGIEAEHSGQADDLWPTVQTDACRRGVAAILKHVGAGSNMCCGHKEYAPKRKIDPTFDMPAFRSAVAELIVGKTPPPLIPAFDAGNRPTLRRGMRGADVAALQRLMGLDPDGVFGGGTEAALRARQRALHAVPDGIAGPKTWALLAGDVPARGAVADTRRIGARGVALIQAFEQCATRLPDGGFQAYPDPGSKDGKPWTIGWGATGEDVTAGTIWTQARCDDRFAEDMRVYAAAVAGAVGDAPTTQNQFDALVSFHYNTGAIATATLTSRHKAGDHAGAREAFAWWNKNNGKVMRGLTLRRAAEAALYADASDG